MPADIPITEEAVTAERPLQVGDRVQLDDQGREDDYGTVVEPPSLMYPDDPGPRVRVERPLVGTGTTTPLVSEVRRVPPGEEQEIWLRPWVVSGESICDDPDEYNHPHHLFVRELDLPEIIRTYLAANGLVPPGATALPVVLAAKDAEIAHLTRLHDERDTIERDRTATRSEAIAAELDRRADGFESQARVFGTPHDSTPAAGIVSTLMDLAREFRADATSLRGGA